MNSRLVLPAVTTSVGGMWVIIGLTKYEWYMDGNPGSGFFPTIAGALLVLMSIIAMLGERKEKPPAYHLYFAYPVIAAVGVVLLAMLIGFFPAMTIYVFGWLFWFEKYSLKLSLVSTVGTVGALYGIFAVWLRVPFPAGKLLEGWLG